MQEEKIPFVDLYAQYLTIKEELDHVISDVITRSAFVRGHYVDKFENDFANAIGVNHCVSCANGTDSLYIAMHALGVRQGDEVIAPAHSWISTTETITQAGGKVVFVDTDRDTFTIDAKKIEEKITSKTVGIIPVHLYGQAADMDAIMKIASRYGLWVLEDCAQAHLAKYNGQQVGTFGNAASYSFYPGKNLGAMGDAGAIVTNDRELARKMTIFARHGGLTKGEHLIEGINSRMDGIQAAILGVKLRHLNIWTARRQQIASKYSQTLSKIINIIPPKKADGREHVWHLYVIRSDRRDSLATLLKNKNIQTVINYPIALPFLDAYKRYNHSNEDFPNAYWNQSRILSLPIYPEMTEQMVDTVLNAVIEFANR